MNANKYKYEILMCDLGLSVWHDMTEVPKMCAGSSQVIVHSNFHQLCNVGTEYITLGRYM